MPTILCNDLKGSSYDGNIVINDKRFGFAKKEFKEVYQVQADNYDQNETDILDTPGLPLLWLFKRGCYCTKRQAKEINTQALLWEVTCNYQSDINPENKDNEDPESAAPQWTWGMETETRERTKDVDGKAIRSTAGEVLAYEGPVVVPILTITRYQSLFNPDVIVNYGNHVNTTTFWGVPPGSALCSGITDQQETINDANYRKVTYTFKIRIDPESGVLKSDGWQLELLNHGSIYLLDPAAPAGTKFSPENQARATDKNQKPITVNLKLDGTIESSEDPAAVVWLPFNVYDDAEFNDLNLGPW